MGRRGRKRKIRLNIGGDTVKSVVAVLLILLSGVVLISFIFPSYSVNLKIQKFTGELFGYVPGLLVPAILLIGGLLYTQALKWKFVELRVFLGLVLLLVSLSSFFSIVGLKGGKIGLKVSTLTRNSISGFGAGFVFFVLICLSFLLIFNKSFQDLVKLVETVSKKSEFFKSIFGIFKKIKKSGDEDGEDDGIDVISDGFVEDTYDDEDDDGEDEDEEEKEGKGVEDVGASFEVIPSISEPKEDGSVNVSSVTGSKGSSPNLPYSDQIWKPPPLELLFDAPSVSYSKSSKKEQGEVIVQTLRSFGIKTEIKDINRGPSVTQFALAAGRGVRISKVKNLHHDLALALASPTGSVRIEAPIPGTHYIGIEAPNKSRVSVFFKELLTADVMKEQKSKRTVVLGKDVSGKVHTYDIARMPHLLVAGATGSGKSVFLHSLILSLLYRCSPQECKFIFMDPKRVEMVHYADIPHLLTPIVTDVNKAAFAFRWAVKEMEKRYNLLEQAKVRNIDAYNEKSGFQALPYIVIVVDELAKIMVSDPTAVEKDIIILAQLARATGIHLVLAVQRPDTTVITGLIKANIPCRVAFNVTSQVDSRVIIDQPGAEKLLGKGDMLFVPPDVAKPIRLQGAFVQNKEIERVVKYLREVGVEPDYEEDVFEVKNEDLSISAGGDAKDDLFDDAVRICISAGKGSASLLQRRLSIGYARAARILDELAAEKYVTSSKGNRARKLLLSNIPKEKYELPEEGVSDLF